MFYIPFWIFVAGSVILAVIAGFIHKVKFMDLQVWIMVAAAAMACDMIFCKQLKLYHYVDMSLKYIGWYSFWANLFAVPAVGFIFMKFLPSRGRNTAIYILAWTLFLTVFELCVIKPSGILHTPVWRTVPWSTIGYFLALLLEYLYFRLLKRMTPVSH